MNKNLKVTLLSFTSVVAASTPIVFAVSCNDEVTYNDAFDLSDYYLDVGTELSYKPYNFMIPDKKYQEIQREIIAEDDTTELTHDQALLFNELISPVKPYGAISYAGGYDIYFAKKIVEEFNLDSDYKIGLRFYSRQFDALLPSLVNDEAFDVVMSNMTNNPTRAKYVDFSDKYQEETNVLLYRAGEAAPISFDQIKNDMNEDINLKIGVQAGTTHEEILKATFGTNRVVSTLTASQSEENLRNGVVKYVFCETRRAQQAISDDSLGNSGVSRISMTEALVDIQSEWSGSSVAFPKNTNPKYIEVVNSAINKFNNKDEMFEAAIALADYVSN